MVSKVFKNFQKPAIDADWLNDVNELTYKWYPQYGVNVKAYGAKGDGVSDDTAAIQAALDTGNSKVIFPSGTYMIKAASVNLDFSLSDGGIHPKSNQHLLLSPDTVLKAIPSAGWASRIISIFLVDNVRISGGRIEGDRDTHDYSTPVLTPTNRSTYEWGWGVAIRGSTNVTIEGSTISKCMGDCVHVDARGLATSGDWVQSKNVRILNCNLDGARRNNISITGCDGFLIKGNTITRAGYNDGVKDGTVPRFGIDLEGYGEGAIDYEIVRDGIVTENRFTDNVNASVSAFTAYRVVMSNNISDHTLSIGYGTEVSIINNTLVERVGATLPSGIASLGNSASYPYTRAIISGNSISGFTAGIDIRGEGALVSGNYVINSRAVGVNCYAAKNAVISGNLIQGVPTAIVLGLSTNIDIMGNNILNASAFGIRISVSSTGNSASDNRIKTVGVGVRLEAGTLKTKGNTITGLTSFGFQLSGGTDLLSENDSIEAPPTNAYLLQASGGVMRIHGACISAATGNMVLATSPASLDVIDCDLELDLSAAPTFAIYVSGATNARVLNNLIHNRNRTPSIGNVINTSTSTGTLIVGNTLLKGTINSNGADTVSNNILTT